MGTRSSNPPLKLRASRLKQTARLTICALACYVQRSPLNSLSVFLVHFSLNSVPRARVLTPYSTKIGDSRHNVYRDDRHDL